MSVIADIKSILNGNNPSADFLTSSYMSGLLESGYTLPRSYSSVSREEQYDLLNHFMKANVPGYSRFAVFDRYPEKARFSYVFLPSEKDLLIHQDVGKTSVVWKTISEGKRQVSTPVSGPKQDNKFTQMTGEVVPFLVSDPLLYGGRCLGVVQYVLNNEPENGILDLLESVSGDISAREEHYRYIQEVSRINHDMKTPLTVIIGYCHVLSRDYDPSYVELVRDTSAELLYMVESLLKEGSIGLGELRFSDTDVNEIVRAQAAKLDERRRRSGDEFSYNVTQVDNVPRQLLDRQALLNEVLYQLFENAYNIHQERRLPRVFSVNYTTSIESDSENRECSVIRISDNAGGMSQEFANAIESGQMTSTHGFGRGYGTRIAKRIIDSHDGKLRVESIEDVGSTFSIYLPIKRDS